MRPAVAVEQLPRYEIAFGDDSKSTVPTKSFSTCDRLRLRCWARIFSYSGRLGTRHRQRRPECVNEPARRVDSNSLAFYDPIEFGHPGKTTMAKLKLTIAFDKYDYLQPLRDGEIKAEGIDLNLITVETGIRHERMFHHG